MTGVQTCALPISHLYSTGFPFVRYRNGDVAVLDERQCPCGRGLPLLGEIHGRSNDLLRAENGAAVPIEVASSIPGTTRLSILIDKNPLPLALQFNFAPEAAARFQAKLRMAESSRLRVVATAGGKHYTVFREVKVTVGGCGD